MRAFFKNTTEELTYDEARFMKEALEDVMKMPGWQMAVDFLDSRREGLVQMLTQNVPVSLEEMCRANRLRGAVDELELFTPMFQEVLGSLRTVLEQQQTELDFDDEEEENN